MLFKIIFGNKKNKLKMKNVFILIISAALTVNVLGQQTSCFFF